MNGHKYLTKERKNGRWVYSYKSNKNPVNNRDHSDYLNDYAVNDHNHNMEAFSSSKEKADKARKKYKKIFGSGRGPVNR